MKKIEKEELQIPKYRWTYYPQHKQGYLRLKNGKIKNTLELIKGKIMLDRDEEGNILGVEFIG